MLRDMSTNNRMATRTNVTRYLTDKQKYYSLMNMDIRNRIRDDDIELHTITSDIQYEIRKIAKRYSSTEDFYFVFYWINNVKKISDLSGIDDTNNIRQIKVPKKSFFDRYYKEIKRERGFE